MFIFGLTADEVTKRRESYSPSEVIDNNPRLSRTVNAIRDG